MRNNPIIVQKYGGGCLETPAKIRAVASSLADLHSRGHRVVAIVSAMGKTTDELVEMAYQLSPHPNRRELDMLLTTGERISMSLMSMALSDLGVPAISFTGSQAGVMARRIPFLGAHFRCAALSRARRTRSRTHRGFSGLSGRECGDQRNHHARPGRQRHHCGRHGRGAKSRVL